MKRILSAIAILLFASLGARAQSSTTFSITVVAPPNCTVTLASNPVSTSGSKLYSGQAGVINFNTSACASASAAATATWDGASTPTAFVASVLSVPVTVAQATVGTHALVLTIPAPLLAITSPVTLPNGQPGVTYSASLATLVKPQGGVPPYSYSLTSALPAGLSLSSSGVVSGVASTPGSVTFSFNVTDSSLLSQVRLTKFIPA